jgi:hypothetical protein
MHCTFQDMQSGRVLEIEFCLDQNGQLSESDASEKCQQVQLAKVE